MSIMINKALQNYVAILGAIDEHIITLALRIRRPVTAVVGVRAPMQIPHQILKMC